MRADSNYDKAILNGDSKHGTSVNVRFYCADRLHGDRVRTRIVVADFTSLRGTVSLSDTYDGVRRGLHGLDVAVLVNNAGMSYTHPDRLLDLPPCCSSDLSSAAGDPIRDVIECNVLATVAMCRIVMPMMSGRGGPETDVGEPERAEQDGGGDDGEPLRSSTSPPPPLTEGGVVITIASASALVPCPLLSVYGASKVRTCTCVRGVYTLVVLPSPFGFECQTVSGLQHGNPPLPPETRGDRDVRWFT